MNELMKLIEEYGRVCYGRGCAVAGGNFKDYPKLVDESVDLLAKIRVKTLDLTKQI